MNKMNLVLSTLCILISGSTMAAHLDCKATYDASGGNISLPAPSTSYELRVGISGIGETDSIGMNLSLNTVTVANKVRTLTPFQQIQLSMEHGNLEVHRHNDIISARFETVLDLAVNGKALLSIVESQMHSHEFRGEFHDFDLDTRELGFPASVSIPAHLPLTCTALPDSQ